MTARVLTRRRCIALLAAAPGTLALAACTSTPTQAPATVGPASGPPSTSNVTLQWDSYNYGAPGIGGKAIDTMVSEFQALYPNITIQGRNIPSTTAGMVSAVTTEIAAGTPPDIAQLPLQNVDSVLTDLGPQAIDTFAPPDEFNATMQHIVPTARVLGERNGHLYGSPFTFSTPTLFYNADLFKAAGLDPDKPPTTWEEVRAYGAQLRDRTSAAPLNIAGIGATWIEQSLLSSNGAAILSDDKTSVRFNEPAAIDIYNWWRGLVVAGIHPPLSSGDALDAFTNGKLGMYLNTTALLNAAETAAQGKWEVRTAGEPGFPDKPVRPVNSGSALFVFTKEPARQLAAWEFLRFAASQRGFTIITSMIGYVPQRDDVLDDPNYLQPIAAKDPNILPPIKQLPNLEMALNWPGKHGLEAQTVFDTAVQNVVYSGQDAQATMDEAAARVADLIKSN